MISSQCTRLTSGYALGISGRRTLTTTKNSFAERRSKHTSRPRARTITQAGPRADLPLRSARDNSAASCSTGQTEPLEANSRHDEDVSSVVTGEESASESIPSASTALDWFASLREDRAVGVAALTFLFTGILSATSAGAAHALDLSGAVGAAGAAGSSVKGGVAAVLGWVGMVLTSAPAQGLYVDLIKTVITWGIPALALVYVLSNSRAKKSRRMEYSGQDADAEGRFAGFGAAPSKPEFLQVTRLNERLQSYAFSLDKAMKGNRAAVTNRNRSSFERGVDINLANTLGPKQLEQILALQSQFRESAADLDVQIDRTARKLRTLDFPTPPAPETPDAAPDAAASSDEAPAAEAGEGAAEEESSEAGGKAEGTDGEGKGEKEEKEEKRGMLAGMAARRRRKKLEEQLSELTLKRATAESRFLAQVKSKLKTTAQQEALNALLQQPEAPGKGFDSLFQREDPAAKKHVFVLKFFGDVQASQASNLREEVTAVLRTADAERGDEVVLCLNTGGGTVTGYGLAAAQLTRLKDAGLKLTICVEQVAASGGYMMACVADEIVSSPFAVLGSIGVISDIPNVYQRLQKEGIEFLTVTAGQYKRTLTPTKKVTKEDLDKQKADIEQILVLFKTFVGSNRPELNIDEVATGETWFGPDALERKLTDRLATSDELLLERLDAGAEIFALSFQQPPRRGALRQALATASQLQAAPGWRSQVASWLLGRDVPQWGAGPIPTPPPQLQQQWLDPSQVASDAMRSGTGMAGGEIGGRMQYENDVYVMDPSMTGRAGQEEAAGLPSWWDDA